MDKEIMENKLSVYIISDDTSIPNLKRAMSICRTNKQTCDWITNHIEIKLVGSSLRNCMTLQGTPDIIIFDMSCITALNNSDTHYILLREFAKNHTSSIICLMSYNMPLADVAFKELNNILNEDVIVEKITNGNKNIVDYLTAKVMLYYPYEEAK
jgi:hypothetical protein